MQALPTKTALTSLKNSLLKDIRKAGSKGSLTSEGFALAEGSHLLEEALRSNCEIHAVLLSETASPKIFVPPHIRTISLPSTIFDELATTEATQGVLSLVKPPEWSMEQIFGNRALIVVLDGIQEPGNAGAILRAAEAFGATGVLCLKGTVNPYNPKAMRGSAGSIFRMPLLAGLDESQVASEFAGRNLGVFAAMPEAHRTIAEVDLRSPLAFVVGSEGQGIRTRLGSEVRIPVTQVESLNVAVAAGILLYEARRQRGQS